MAAIRKRRLIVLDLTIMAASVPSRLHPCKALTGPMNLMKPKNAGRSWRFLSWAALALTVIVGPVTVSGAGLKTSFQAGALIMRNVDAGPQGKPIFVEYDTDGAVLSVIGEATEANALADVDVVSGMAYRSHVGAYEDCLEENRDGPALGAYLLSPDENATASFTSLNGDPVTKPALLSTTRSVLVRHQDRLVVAQHHIIDRSSVVNSPFVIHTQA